jgi:NAD(P)-dependent dehydrogenase (short-subunit alcohol dehydrogenase family)
LQWRDAFFNAVNFCSLSGLWAVLNTACLCCRGRLENQDISHWDALLKYNVIGTLRTARTFLPLLKNTSGKGEPTIHHRIENISSVLSSERVEYVHRNPCES